MPVPATRGQLRTRLRDMQVGDFMVCNYSASSGAVGLFTNFGGSAGAEISVNGDSVPNGSFYFIKADRGLLIADRNIQTSITWLTVNIAGYICGLENKNNTVTPAMTSNTAPSGVVTASKGTNPYYAFNKTTSSYSDCWSVSGFTSGDWLQYQFPSPTVVKAYAISSTRGNSTLSVTRAPKRFTLSGSNDGSNWEVLDSRNNVTQWAYGQAHTNSFHLLNEKAYTYYRLTVYETNGDSTLEIGELRLTEFSGVIRSLSGGVAFADQLGNKASSDGNVGGWPIVNEWDTYIRKSNLNGKITAGDDAVWHFSTTGTWCQESPILSMQYNSTTATSSHRIVRGGGVASRIYFAANSPSSTIGWRPVIEYAEG